MPDFVGGSKDLVQEVAAFDDLKFCHIDWSIVWQSVKRTVCDGMSKLVMKRLIAIAVVIFASWPEAATFPKDDQAIVHVLNRVAFGPAPGDVEKVRAMGIQRYIDEQLRPERIADAGMSARLAGLTTDRMSSHADLPAVRDAAARGAAGEEAERERERKP